MGTWLQEGSAWMDATDRQQWQETVGNVIANLDRYFPDDQQTYLARARRTRCGSGWSTSNSKNSPPEEPAAPASRGGRLTTRAGRPEKQPAPPGPGSVNAPKFSKPSQSMFRPPGL